MGDALSLLAALCWSVANVTIARGAVGKSGDNGAFLSILITLLMATALWLAIGPATNFSSLSKSGLLWFAAGGALTIFFGRVFYHASIQWLGAMRGSSVKRLAPFFSVLLGVLLLGESLGATLIAGMVLIFTGFGLLIQESRSEQAAPSSGTDAANARAPAPKLWTNPGLIYGAVSALAYASGNIARKYGLLSIPDPALGVMAGAAVGLLLFLGAALFMRSYREGVLGAFTRYNPWLLTAGVLSSIGQILFFIAIDLSSVSRAALIVSTETFMTIFISMLVFRGREKLTRSALAAALLGVAGAGVIIAGRG